MHGIMINHKKSMTWQTHDLVAHNLYIFSSSEFTYYKKWEGVR